MTEIPEAENQNERWKKLRDELHDTDIDTYYAVHSDGHHQGWKGLTVLLENKLIDEMDELRVRQDAAYDVDPDSALEYSAMLRGLQIARNLLTQSNQ